MSNVFCTCSCNVRLTFGNMFRVIFLIPTFGRYVLENYANMSSPTILFVLEKLRDEAQKLPTGSRHLIHPWTVVVGFGPGMTMEGILLKNC
jgi:predicted naringenin-chalcone synthase